LGKFRIGYRLGQADQFFQAAENGVFLLIKPAHGFKLVDRCVLRVACFGVEKASLGT